MAKYHKKYAFTVEIDGIESAAFEKCSALKFSIDYSEHQEGGAVSATKEPGFVKYDDVTLERGLTDNEDLYNWAKTYKDGGEAPKDMAIVQKDRAGNELNRWNCAAAQVKEFEVGPWDNKSSEAAIEKIMLVIEGFEKA